MKTTTHRFDAFDSNGKKFVLIHTRKFMEIRLGHFSETFGDIRLENGTDVNCTGAGQYETVERPPIKLTSEYVISA